MVLRLRDQSAVRTGITIYDKNTDKSHWLDAILEM